MSLAAGTEMAASVLPTPQKSPDALESAGRLVDEHMQADSGQLELSALLKIATHSEYGREKGRE